MEQVSEIHGRILRGGLVITFPWHKPTIKGLSLDGISNCNAQNAILKVKVR